MDGWMDRWKVGTHKLNPKQPPRRGYQRYLPDLRAECGEQLLPELTKPIVSRILNHFFVLSFCDKSLWCFCYVGSRPLQYSIGELERAVHAGTGVVQLANAGTGTGVYLHKQPLASSGIACST